jgi:hypothetical protein
VDCCKQPGCVSLFYVIDTGSTGSRARHHVTNWGLPIYTPRFESSDDLPLTFLGAPVSIGALLKPGSRSPGAEPQDRDWSGRPPGTGPNMYPFSIIGVAPRYIPAGAVIELAGIRLSCTSTPTVIWKKHRRGESNSGALIPWPPITHLSVKSHSGIAPDPSYGNL